MSSLVSNPSLLKTLCNTAVKGIKYRLLSGGKALMEIIHKQRHFNGPKVKSDINPHFRSHPGSGHLPHEAAPGTYSHVARILK